MAAVSHPYTLIAQFCFLLNFAAATSQCVEQTYQVLSVNEGTSLTLPCVFRNITATFNIYWYGDDKVLYTNEEGQTTIGKYSLEYRKVNSDPARSSNLTIVSVHRSDPLNYTCRASFTTVPRCKIDEIMTVVVKYPATITSIGPSQAPFWTPAEPGKIFVNETNSITLNCNSRGEPSPSINWTKIDRDGDSLENVSLPETTMHGDLMLTNVSRTQSGIYRCESTNLFGNDTADVELVVQHAPEVHPTQTDIRAAPKDAVAIGCDVTANPEPLDFYWLKDGVRIFDDEESDSESIPNAISLSCFSTFIRFVIFKLDQEKHYGNYTCVATNPLGTSKATIEISGRPLAPVVLNKETQGSYGRFYTLMWSPATNTEENSTQLIEIPILRYIIQYQRQDFPNVSTVSLVWPDEAMSASTDKHGSYVLFDLTENTSYVGLLCPENDYGLGDCTSFNFTTSEVIYKPPPESDYSGNACADSDRCVGTWVPSAAERYLCPSVSMVTLSSGIISWLFIS